MAIGLAESLTLSDAAMKFLMQLPPEARTNGQAEVTRFVRWLGGHRAMQSLSAHEVSGYMETLGHNVKNLDKKVDPIKMFLAYAKKQGYADTNLGTSLRVPKNASRGSIKTQTLQTAEMVQLTPEGYQQTLSELENLKAERPRIAETLRQAMADKDFRENAPLDAARDQQAHIEARIRELEGLIKRAEMLPSDTPQATKIQIGTTVDLSDLSTSSDFRVTLVHSHEANVTLSKVSISSPLGKALIDHVSGEEVEVVAPAGMIKYRIRAVEPNN